jgi:hypothetical protein
LGFILFSIFNKAGYIRTADGLELYQGSELAEMLSDRDNLGIFFEVTKLPSGSRLAQIVKHGDAREVMEAYKAKKKIWVRSGWPVENLHIICLNVSAISGPILDAINTALFVEDLVTDLGTRIMKLLAAPKPLPRKHEWPLAA